MQIGKRYQSIHVKEQIIEVVAEGNGKFYARNVSDFQDARKDVWEVTKPSSFKEVCANPFKVGDILSYNNNPVTRYFVTRVEGQTIYTQYFFKGKFESRDSYEAPQIINPGHFWKKVGIGSCPFEIGDTLYYKHADWIVEIIGFKGATQVKSIKGYDDWGIACYSDWSLTPTNCGGYKVGDKFHVGDRKRTFTIKKILNANTVLAYNDETKMDEERCFPHLWLKPAAFAVGNILSCGSDLYRVTRVCDNGDVDVVGINNQKLKYNQATYQFKFVSQDEPGKEYFEAYDSAAREWDSLNQNYKDKWNKLAAYVEKKFAK